MVGTMSATVDRKITLKKLKNTSWATRSSSTAISDSDMMRYDDNGTLSLWSSPKTHILGWTMRKISSSRETLQEGARKWGGHTRRREHRPLICLSLALHLLGHKTVAFCVYWPAFRGTQSNEIPVSLVPPFPSAICACTFTLEFPISPHPGNLRDPHPTTTTGAWPCY